MTAFFRALEEGKVSTEEALTIFDRLEPVGPDFMMGAWKGAGFPTDHPLDGALDVYHWHGKRFEGPEAVHPLVFSTIGGGRKNLNPVFMMPALGLLDRLPFLKSPVMGRIFQVIMPLLATRRPRARLRLTEYRGQVSATMIYDHLPVNDVFRKADDNTVMGIMDMKGMSRPFFFVLHREVSGSGA